MVDTASFRICHNASALGRLLIFRHALWGKYQLGNRAAIGCSSKMRFDTQHGNSCESLCRYSENLGDA
jgi:hypothetical protein